MTRSHCGNPAVGEFLNIQTKEGNYLYEFS